MMKFIYKISIATYILSLVGITSTISIKQQLGNIPVTLKNQLLKQMDILKTQELNILLYR